MTGNLVGWRRGVATSAAATAVAAGMVLGSVGTTHADPSTAPSPSTSSSAASSASSSPAPSAVTTASAVPSSTPKPTVAVEGGAAAGVTTTAAAAAPTGDALDQLAEEYATGAGGGQLSNLLKVSLKLRAMGYKPSKRYLDELSAAMKYRPNQLPLIDALKDTIAYQQKLKAQMDILTQAQSVQNGAAMGAGAAPGPGAPVSVVATPPAAPPAAPPAPTTP
jgi:hypothetical protein